MGARLMRPALAENFNVLEVNWLAALYRGRLEGATSKAILPSAVAQREKFNALG